VASNAPPPPADANPADAKPAAPEADNALWATVATGAVVVAALFLLFRFASTAEYRAEAQVPFLVACVAVCAALIAATVRPRLVGHGLAATYSVAAVLGGVVALQRSPYVLLPLFVLASGVLAAALTYGSYQRRSRPAWSFLCALLAVMAVSTLFGAPKVRHMLDVTMWTALMIPGLLTAAVTGLGMVSEQYRERGALRMR
jgi:hypothetical protein